MDNFTNIACKWLEIVKINSKSNEDFTKSYDNESEEGYVFEVNVFII